jgi:hypothetical protein
LSPVTSYGLIAIRYLTDVYLNSLFSKSNSINNGNDSIQFLLIQRKDSLSFVEFIRGKYNSHENEYIGLLLRGMTQKEHDLLLTKSFDELWNGVWGENSTSRTHKNDYDNSEKNLEKLKEVFLSF